LGEKLLAESQPQEIRIAANAQAPHHGHGRCPVEFDCTACKDGSVEEVIVHRNPEIFIESANFVKNSAVDKTALMRKNKLETIPP
jgi:hypothetical protein